MMILSVVAVLVSAFKLCKGGFGKTNWRYYQTIFQKKVQFPIHPAPPKGSSRRGGIHIVEADSGKTVYSHNAKRALLLASNMKIITTAAALKFLGSPRPSDERGSDYDYKTQIGLSGPALTRLDSRG